MSVATTIIPSSAGRSAARRSSNEWYDEQASDTAAEARRIFEHQYCPLLAEGDLPLLDTFLADRGLDRDVGRELGFRFKPGHTIGPALAFLAGDGVKVRSVVPHEDGYIRRVEPAGAKFNGVTVVQRGSEPSDTVLLCESETDLWALGQAVRDVDLALMPAGAKAWREDWAVRLRPYGRVLVATDNDAAGEEGAAKVGADLPCAVRLRPPEGVKDWCEALGGGHLDAAGLEALIDTAAEPVFAGRLDPARIVELAEEVAVLIDAPLGSRAVAAEVHLLLERRVSLDTVRHVLDVAENPRPHIEVIDEAAIAAMPEPEEQPEIFGNGQLVEGEVMGWYGPAGVGKSLLLMQAGLALAHGAAWFLDPEVPILRPRRVLYVTGEGRWEMHRRRLLAMQPEMGSGDPSGRGQYIAFGKGGAVPVRLDVPSHVRDLRAVIEEHGVEVLLLDTFRTLHSKNENASEEMEEVWFALRGLCAETGCAAIVTHHTRKGSSGTRNKRDAARGGSFQENVATAWAIDFHQNQDGRLDFTATKTRNGPPIPPLVLVRDPVTLCCRATEETAADGAHPELARAIRERGGAVLLSEIAGLGIATDKTLVSWARAEPDRYEVTRDGAGARAPQRIALRTGGAVPGEGTPSF
jgi:hypothetical protein